MYMKINHLNDLIRNAMENSQFGNTFDALTIVDARALAYAVNNNTNGKSWFSCSCGFDFCMSSEHQKVLNIEVSRYAMDGHGYGVGYEYFTISLPLHKKKDFGITGIPHALSPNFIFLSQMGSSEIDIKTPEVDGTDSFDSDDEAYDEGSYFPPDEDFAYHELEYLISMALDHLPEAEFDSETRTWSIGDHSWSLED